MQSVFFLERGKILSIFHSLTTSLIIASSLGNLKVVCTLGLLHDSLQSRHMFSVQVLNAGVPKDSNRRKVNF